MNEILFRGKRTDDKGWVEGFYSWYDLIAVDEGMEPETGFTDFSEYEVISDTVSQYTGAEVGGKKVFIGDILEFHRDITVIGIVECKNHMTEIKWIGDKAEGLRRDFGFWMDERADSLRVIGNRWDNPEL